MEAFIAAGWIMDALAGALIAGMVAWFVMWTWP